MTAKVSAMKRNNNIPDKVSVKYVKKAHLWCTTTFLNGKQSQEWTSEKPA